MKRCFAGMTGHSCLLIGLITGFFLTGGFWGCSHSMRPAKRYPAVPEEVQAKDLTPAPGKSLVYFYYGRKPGIMTIEVSLDGAASVIDQGIYIVWELEPGRHTFHVKIERWMSVEEFSTSITTKSDQTSYYRLHSSNENKDRYTFLPASESAGRKSIHKFSLMAWFRDGNRVFQRELMPGPKAQETAATSSMDGTPTGAETPQPVQTPNVVPTPEAEADKHVQEGQGDSFRVEGRYYALVIGISQYTHLESLPTAVHDARAVAEVLRNEYGFKVNTLFDGKATREGILDTLRVLRRLLAPEDKLLIYYAGHGQLDSDGQTAYWLPVDAARDSTSQWIIADSLTASIKQIPANQILVVADSVYSGMLKRSVHAELNNDAGRRLYLEQIIDTPSRMVITSGASQPVLPSEDAELSLFAHAFVSALNKMERPLFAAEELFFGSILEAVAGQSDQLPELSVIRNSGHLGGDFIFVKQ